MIRHVFIGALKEDMKDRHSDGEIINEFRTLENCTPEMRDFHVGMNLGWFQDNGCIILTADFPDWNSWSKYIEHPAHTRIVKEVLPLFNEDSIIVVQFEL